MRHDPRSAECFVFTFRDGLLSPVGHDLKLRVEQFEIDVDEAARTVEARFDASSLRVVGASRQDEQGDSGLSEKDRRDIEATISKEVLEAGRHPHIRFRSRQVVGDPSGQRIVGDLELHGHSRPVSALARLEERKWVVEATLHQPDFGIKPYSAMLGTLRVKPNVRVKLIVPAR